MANLLLPNTRPGSTSKGHEVFLKLLSMAAQPSLGAEDSRIGEYAFVIVDVSSTHSDGGLVPFSESLQSC